MVSEFTSKKPPSSNVVLVKAFFEIRKTMTILGFLTLIFLVPKITFTSQNRKQIPSWYDDNTGQLTLRDYLIHPDGFHLAMAPAFFGFYAYFGAMMALEEMGAGILPAETLCDAEAENIDDTCSNNANSNNNLLLKSLAGSSAGAMAAILISSGISPRDAAIFASSMKVTDFADPPGIFAAFRGNKFEQIMKGYLMSSATTNSTIMSKANEPLLLQNGIIPVAVTAFDLRTLKEQILTRGCMAKAARASATFPGLFQPVPWSESIHNSNSSDFSILIDGGITDWLGLNGLQALPGKQKRVVNLIVGCSSNKSVFGSWLLKKSSRFQSTNNRMHSSDSETAPSLVSIFIANTPPCGPWAMSNGEKAVNAARQALTLALDTPMSPGDVEGHYILTLDASASLRGR
mmetsp:Transcript_14758/g.21071  ORF Transcript_14758/g.21071 Transcript_14758/m.21071 type:complete len:403 (+) Transcript_14758:99-1307(+)